MAVSQKMSLQQHLAHLGVTPHHLSISRHGIQKQAVERALQGQPIAHEQGQRIAAYLNDAHGLKPGTLQPEDIGLTTWKHPTMEDPTMQRNTANAIVRSMGDVDQCRLAAAIITRQREERAIRAAVEQALRQPEVQRMVRGIIERKRQPAYASSGGMIYRSQPARRPLEWRGYEPDLFGPVVGRR